MNNEPKFVSDMSIEAIGREGNRYVAAAWNPLYVEMHEQLMQAFQEIKDGAYGLYLDQLLPPVFDRLQAAGYQTQGAVGEDDFIIGKCLNFRDSLEKVKWGTAENQSRLFWNIVRNERDEPIGTLVTELAHSHLNFDIPAQPRFHSLAQTDRKSIIAGIRRIKEG